MPALSVRSYSDLLRRLLALKGSEAIRNAGEDLLAVIALEQELQHPEWLFLKGQHLFTSARQATAIPAGGLFSAVELFNPAGSGVLITPYLIMVDNQGAAQPFKLVIGTGEALGGGVGKAQALDTREIAVTGAAEFHISATLGAVHGGSLDIDHVNNTVNEEVTPFQGISAGGIVIAPNGRVSVAAINAAVATVCWFFYRERLMEQTELPVA